MWIEAGMDGRRAERAWHPLQSLKHVTVRAARAWARAWVRFAAATGEVRPPLVGADPWKPER
jgi:hypothetical protein